MKKQLTLSTLQSFINKSSLEIKDRRFREQYRVNTFYAHMKAMGYDSDEEIGLFDILVDEQLDALLA